MTLCERCGKNEAWRRIGTPSKGQWSSEIWCEFCVWGSPPSDTEMQKVENPKNELFRGSTEL